MVLATGLTESNALLLWDAAARPELPAGFGPWRDRLAALRPSYLRVHVDWAQLQPTAGVPPAVDGPADGCLRGIPPCAAFRGLREQLEAIASQQRARGGPPEVEVVVFGVPAWAAAPASGCERRDAAPRNRPITATGLDGYRALLRDVIALGREVGVRLRWWSPWNEPNHPAFISPQRAACSTASPTLAAGVYASLVRAARDVLAAEPGDQRLVLGEMSGTPTPTPRRTGIEELVAALPGDVACASRTWSQHQYAVTRPGRPVEDAVAALERALDARACTRGAHIWVTETGAGGPDPGGERPGEAAALRAGCRTEDALLRRWAADPRVDAAFQYTFREDTAYPVGLVDAALTRTYPTYDLWRAWGERAPDAPPPPLPVACR